MMPPEPLTGPRRRSLAALWLTLCLDMVGFGILLPVLPLHAVALGAAPATIAALAATYSLAQLVAAPLLGRLGDRVGRRPVILLSVAGACAAMLVLSVADELWLLFAARLLAGACGANVASAQAYVAERWPAEQRARALGVLGSALGLGFVLGPALGGLLVTPAWPGLPFAVAAGVSAINWILAWCWLPANPPAAPRERPSPGLAAALHALKHGPAGRLVVINLGFFAAFAAMESTFALLLAQRLGFGPWGAGLLFALVGVTIVLTQGGLVGAAVARLGEASTLRLGLAVLVGGLLLIGVGANMVIVAAGAITVALGNGLVSPALHAMISRRAAPDQQGLQLGLAASAGSLGRVLGPLAAGVAFTVLGPGAPALLGSVVAAGLVVMAGHDSLEVSRGHNAAA